MIWICISLILIGILWFYRSKPFPKIEDDFFGQLVDEGYGLIGYKMFMHINKDIQICIDKDNSSLPTDEQKAFFNKVELQYDLLIEKIIPLIENEFRNWNPDFKIKDFKTEFFLTWIKIPKSDNLQWELSFDSIHDKNHVFTIYFLNFEPRSILIDG